MLAPRRRRHSLLPFAILACGALLPAVQARADAGLLDLPLEDLLAVEVRAAGKRDEQIRDIPASVTILNRAEIQRYGWVTFEELLRNLPGLFILDTIDERLTGARGTVGGGVQLLVNGVPQHQTRQKVLTITEIAQVNIPVESIDRIEVIRGPMSVIYGNNAFLGVINVVTNEVGRNGPRVSASYGSRDSGRLFARLGTETDSGFVVLNAGAYRTDGLDGAYADMLGPDQLATLDPRMHRSLDGDVPKQDLSLDLSAAYGDFSADLRWTQTDYGVYIFTPSFDDGNQATITTWHAALGWEHAFSDTLGMRASGIASEERLDIDRFDFIAPDLGGEQHQDNRRWELERVLPRVRQLTSAPVLVRLDGAHDAAVNRRQLAAATGVDYLIKWNPRREDPETWLAEATARGAWEQVREGKRQALFSVDRSDEHDGEQHRWRLVVRLIERTIDRKGQLLLTPEIELEGWTHLVARIRLRQLDHPQALPRPRAVRAVPQ